jgi:hypothetical protein
LAQFFFWERGGGGFDIETAFKAALARVFSSNSAFKTSEEFRDF